MKWYPSVGFCLDVDAQPTRSRKQTLSSLELLPGRMAYCTVQVRGSHQGTHNVLCSGKVTYISTLNGARETGLRRRLGASAIDTIGAIDGRLPTVRTRPTHVPTGHAGRRHRGSHTARCGCIVAAGASAAAARRTVAVARDGARLAAGGTARGRVAVSTASLRVPTT